MGALLCRKAEGDCRERHAHARGGAAMKADTKPADEKEKEAIEWATNHYQKYSEHDKQALEWAINFFRGCAAELKGQCRPRDIGELHRLHNRSFDRWFKKNTSVLMMIIVMFTLTICVRWGNILQLCWSAAKNSKNLANGGRRKSLRFCGI
jgi:hypothetical protein